MFLDLTSVSTPGHRRDRGCASRHADSIIPKRNGCTSISQSEVGGELATPKLQSFVQQSLMVPPLASLRQYTGLSSARLRSSRICFRCNRIWLQNFLGLLGDVQWIQALTSSSHKSICRASLEDIQVMAVDSVVCDALR